MLLDFNNVNNGLNTGLNNSFNQSNGYLNNQSVQNMEIITDIISKKQKNTCTFLK